MTTGTIQQLIQAFEEAFANLQVDIAGTELEALAIFIHKAMGIEARHFHTPEHILSLIASHNPIQTLAAMFHDIVYYQVDRGFSSEVWATISPYIREIGTEIYIDPDVPADDRLFNLAIETFDFQRGQKLSPFAGLNEFLSALVMCRKLGEILPEDTLLKAIVYIEATIPFRVTNARGEGPFESLAARLSRVSQKHHIPMTASEIDATIQGAVTFANEDVKNFAEEDPTRFLDNTWKLLPETNVALRSGNIYSIREYRMALQKMAQFMDQLDTDSVFHSYKDTPTTEELRKMVTLARHNVDAAREYLGTKLLSVAILEALAEITGGDTPLSLFVGDSQAYQAGETRLESYLSDVETLTSVDRPSPVYILMEVSKASQSEFDIQHSPLTLYLYKSLGPDMIKTLLASARDMFAGNTSAHEFLDQIDGPIVADIAAACAAMVPTRSQQLTQYARRRR